MATSTAAIALSDAEKNSSLSDSMFTPYAIDRVKDPVRLASQKRTVSPRERDGRAKTDVQMHMFQEALGGFREPVEENAYCLVDLVIEPTHS